MQLSNIIIIILKRGFLTYKKICNLITFFDNIKGKKKTIFIHISIVVNSMVYKTIFHTYWYHNKTPMRYKKICNSIMFFIHLSYMT